MKLFTSPTLFFVTLTAVLLLGGCATKPTMYNWGSYQAQVYSHFKNTGSAQQQIAALEKSLLAGKPNTAVPPGYHAHLGLLYGEVGRISDMEVAFETEKLLFPESAQFMDFMLNNMRKNKTIKGAL